jgi:UrcA family protein
MHVPMILKLQRIGAVLVLTLGSGLAIAGGDTQLRTETVFYGDLNLASAPGVAALYGRIAHAAEDVCGPRERPGSFVPRLGYRDCVGRAIDAGVAKVGNAQLSAYHARKEHGAAGARLTRLGG